MPGEVQGSLVQRAFSGGELTPAAWGRADIEKYAHGLKTARNVYVMKQGGVTNRPGTEYITTVKQSNAGKIRLIPFVFSQNVAFMLEFGNGYMRAYQAGEQVRTTPAAWSSLVAYVAGDLVAYSGENYYCVAANTNQAPPNTGYWYQLTGSIYECPTPYAIADLPQLQFVQCRNVMYLACGMASSTANYPVYMLTCSSSTDWVFSKLNYTPTATQSSPPTGLSASGPNGVGNLPVYALQGYQAAIVGLTPAGGNIPNFAQNIGQFITPGAQFTSSPTGAPGGQLPSFPNINVEYYAVTAVNNITGVESLPMAGINGGYYATSNLQEWYIGLDHTGAVYCPYYQNAYLNSANISDVTAITASNPMTITVTNALTFPSGDMFTLAGTGLPIDGSSLTAFVSGNTLVFPDVDSTGFPTTAQGSIICLTSVFNNLAHAPSAGLQFYTATGAAAGLFDSAPFDLSWSAPAVPGQYTYNVYKKSAAGLWGFMGSTSTTGFVDSGQVPDTSKGLPVYYNNFIGSGGNPSTIGIYQQRLLLGNASDQQDWVFASNTGVFDQFTTTTPTPVDSDTVQFEVAGQEYNPITQFIDNGFLLIFTQTGELSCYGNGSAFSPGPITPTSIGLVQQAFFGASQLLKPLSIGKNVIYIQSQGSLPRELLYNYYINGYSGTDLSIYSNHLFDGYTITDWCYQQVPNSLVQCVRSDGALLTLAYMPELQLAAWTHSDTEGLFENVCAIPEGTETALYTVVNRNGTRFVERFANQIIPKIYQQEYITSGELVGQIRTVQVPDPDSFVFMDCSSYYDGRDTSGNPMVTPLAGDFTPNGNGFDLLCPSGFVSTPGMCIILYDPTNGNPYRCMVLVGGSGNPSVAVVRPDLELPTYMQNSNIATWAIGVNELTGLSYLNGYEVSILADGAVVSSPSTETMVQVSGGVIPLDNYYAYVRVGLAYFADVESLAIDTPQQGQTAQDKPNLVNRVGVYTQTSRGLWFGSRAPMSDELAWNQGLTQVKARGGEAMGQVPKAWTGIEILAVDAEWAYGGHVFVRQPDPLPMTILSLIPAGKFMMGS